jgi:hypothetical protein
MRNTAVLTKKIKNEKPVDDSADVAETSVPVIVPDNYGVVSRICPAGGC